MITPARQPIMQVAFVVEDIHKAVEQWARQMRVGPFFLQEHVRYQSLTYRGAECGADVSLAFAFSGELQIELVCQHNEAPSIYRDAVAAAGYGAQHLGTLCADMAAELARFAALGIEPIQRGVSASGVETIFLPFQSGPAGVIELIQSSPQLDDAFALMRAAAAGWDGETAIAG